MKLVLFCSREERVREGALCTDEDVGYRGGVNNIRMLPDEDGGRCDQPAQAASKGGRPTAKPSGMAFWESLGSPSLVVAPMVDASELAWRLLSRRHGAHLCYTPMLHSAVFVRDARYRAEALASTPEDRPLIVQFCANNTAQLLEAALLAESHCDAVDINLGCPQAIARRGHYGSFLQDDWDLLHDMVSTLHARLSVPVTCKIRVFEDVDRTVKYARMLEAAGCQMLTVHGRTREQKGPLTGLASWMHIRKVVKSVNIPVLANGNIQYLQDVQRCIDETGVKGVMSAEGNLYNPAIFEGTYLPCWDLCLEYLDLAEEHPCPTSFVRTHLFKMMHHLLLLPENAVERQEIAKGQNLIDFRKTVLSLKSKFLPFHVGLAIYQGDDDDTYDLKVPPWICQPYVRIPPEEHLRKLAEKQSKTDSKLEPENSVVAEKRKLEENEDDGATPQLSKKKLKRLQHSQKIKLNPHGRKCQEKCSECANPLGSKCGFKLCRACCRRNCFSEKKDCPGHRILAKTRYEKFLQYQALEASTGEDTEKDIGEKNNNANSTSAEYNISNGLSGSVEQILENRMDVQETNENLSIILSIGKETSAS